MVIICISSVNMVVIAFTLTSYPTRTVQFKVDALLFFSFFPR